jgi:tetratricopeptide (TPR) repeat protein
LRIADCSEGRSPIPDSAFHIPHSDAALRLSGALWRFWRLRGYLAEGRRWYAAALAHPAAGERTATRAAALGGAGSLAWAQSDYAAARALHEESLAIRRELGDRLGVAASLNNLGDVELARGDYAAAQVLYKQSLAIVQELGYRAGIAFALEGWASAAAALGRTACAARAWGAGERLRQELGSPRPPKGQLRFEREVTAARAALGDDAAFDRAWQEGRAMTLEQAVTLALEDSAAGGRE